MMKLTSNEQLVVEKVISHVVDITEKEGEDFVPNHENFILVFSAKEFNHLKMALKKL